MKRVILLCVLLLAVSQEAWAEVPQTMSYQGVLRQSDGNLVPDGDYSITFKLYDTPDGADTLWTETQTLPVERGIFSAVLGSKKTLDLDFNDTYWLGVSVGVDPELAPRVELTASPYAFRAAFADSAALVIPSDGDWVISGNDMYSGVSDNVGVGTTSPEQKLHVDGNIRFDDQSSQFTLTGRGSCGPQAVIRGDGGHCWMVLNVDHNDGTPDSPISSQLSLLTGRAGLDVMRADITADVSGNLVLETDFESTASRANDIIFAPRRSERMRITTGGTVGIGTTTPQDLLDVVGTVRMNGLKMPPGASVGYVLTSDANGVGAWGPGGALPPGSAGQTLRHDSTSWVADSLLYNNGANVGIGTTSPGQKLDVNGKIEVGDDMTGATAGAIRWTGANFEGYDGSSWRALDVQSTSGGGWTDQGTVVRLTTSTDRIGIGTTNPLYPVAVERGMAGGSPAGVKVKGYRPGPIPWSYLILGKSNGTMVGQDMTTQPGDTLGVIEGRGINASSTEGTGGRVLFVQPEDAFDPVFVPGEIVFETSDGSSPPVERMKIYSMGEVEAFGDVFIGGTLYMNGNVIRDVAYPTSSGHAATKQYVDDRWWVLGNNMWSSPTGNVGIGTTAPTAKLHIGGTPGSDGIRFPDGTLQTTAPTGGGGDITAVYAGTGLSGGGTSGDVTLDVQVPLDLSGSGGGAIVKGTNNGSGHGVYGYAAGSGSGVYGDAAGSTGRGVQGYNTTGSSGVGVYGYASGGNGAGVKGEATSNYGVHGVAGTGGTGVCGQAHTGGAFYGGGARGAGVVGSGTSGGATKNYGGYFTALGDTGIGVYGQVAGGAQSLGYGGYFFGNVHVTGTINKGACSFKIDHPIDPEDKYLYHSCVESPDMKNVYDGVVVLEAEGEARVDLPEWFEALNRDFRYQLTCIGGFAPVYVAEEISGNRFKIAGGEPGMKVSWQVTGIRHDPYAEEHPMQVEVEKPDGERGKYLYPEAYGMPETMGVDYREGDEARD